MGRRLKAGCLGAVLGFIASFVVPGLLYRILAPGEYEARRNDLPDVGVMLFGFIGCTLAGLLIGLVLGGKARPGADVDPG